MAERYAHHRAAAYRRQMQLLDQLTEWLRSERAGKAAQGTEQKQ